MNEIGYVEFTSFFVDKVFDLILFNKSILIGF
jgi:hypothetical protein